MDDIKNYCEKLREHVALSERKATAAQLSLDAIDSFEKIMHSKMPSETSMLPIVTAAISRNLGPYHIGIELLLALSKHFAIEIEAIWRNLSESSSAHERWVAISAARDDRMPFDLAKVLVERGVADKSSKVRLFAVECVLVRDIRSLLPELKQQARTEKASEVRKRIDWVTERME